MDEYIKVKDLVDMLEQRLVFQETHGFYRDAGYTSRFIESIADIPHIDVTPKSEWVSVEDRLPEETQDYLVVLNNEDIDIRLFNSNNDPYQTDFLMRNKFLFCDSKGDWHITDRVTHWMPLPEPPT
jgi:hypothetical protein